MISANISHVLIFQYLAGILGVLLVFWGKAVNSLAGQFEEAMEAVDETA